MKIQTETFRGEVPRMTPRGLPDNASQDATNARLVTGDVTAWRRFLPEQPIARPAPIASIWKMTTDVWLSFSEEVDFARGIIPGDTTFRTYITGLDVPRFTNLAMATSGAQPWPAQTRPLGVPGPVSPPTVSAGLDPAPTTFSIDVLDEGDKLATEWTVNPPLIGSRYATVTQDGANGNPSPSYLCTYDENRDPGQEAWAYRDFGVAGVNVLDVEVEFQLINRGQACVNLGCTSGGAGISAMYVDGLLAIYKRTAWGCLFSVAVLATVPVSPLPAITVWNKLKVTAVLNDTGTKTVTAKVISNLGVELATLTATATFDDGNMCGFANGVSDDAPGQFYTRYDNYRVRATGSTNYVPVNTATSYVYTFVNDLGEESAPSFASATVLRPDGVAITVTTQTGVPSGVSSDYGITTKRIYRAATGATGTVFLFVAEIPLAQADYVDTVPDTELGEVLESEDWDLPPSDLRGILALPNGVMVGFRRNQLCLSAQNRPHAWPVRNRLTTDTDIVGIGNIDTTVVIGTDSFPYVASGNDPSAYSMAKFEVPQACVAKRSIAYLTGTGVVFASPDGLLAASGVGQIRNLTESIFTREQWQALNPRTLIGVAHDDVYHGFYYRLVSSDVPLDPSFSNPSTVVISNGGKTATSISTSSSQYGGARTASPKLTGKWYFEVEIGTVPLVWPAFGIAPGDWTWPTNTDSELGQTGVSLRADASIYSKGVSPVPSGLPALGSGARGMIAFDIDAGKVWFGRNGVWTSGGDPASGAAPSLTTSLTTGAFAAGVVPALSTGIQDYQGSATIALGAAEQTYSAPEGFTPWSDGTVENGAFMLDMKSTGFGLVPTAFHASAVHADPKSDTLYLLLDSDAEPTDDNLPTPATPLTVDGTVIYTFNADDKPMTYRWKSKLYVLPQPGAFLLVQVKGETLANTVFRAYKRVQAAGVWTDVLLREVVVTSNEPFNLPMSDDYREFWWEVISTDVIQGVQVVTNVEELT